MQEYMEEGIGDDLPLFASRPVCVIEPHELPSSEGLAAKAKVILRALKSGPITTVEAETIVHRGQAVIHQLREQGHRIDTIRIKGQLHYQWLGFSRVVKVDPSLEKQYYETSHWRSISLERKRIDGFRCKQCGSLDELQTHHWRYNLFMESLRYDLITLCRDCHVSVHEAVSGSSVHFPNYVCESIAERIRNNG